MVILVSTKEGFQELKFFVESGRFPVWFGAGVLEAEELSNLHSQGISLTIFSYSIDPKNREDLECAIETIAEHHPGQRIWSEI